jgi:hypothetical protein
VLAAGCGGADTRRDPPPVAAPTSATPAAVLDACRRLAPPALHPPSCPRRLPASARHGRAELEIGGGDVAGADRCTGTGSRCARAWPG